MRLDLVKIWTVSAPSARARTKASCRPPLVDSCAPRSMGGRVYKPRPPASTSSKGKDQWRSGQAAAGGLATGGAPPGRLVPVRQEELERVVQRVVHALHH